MRAEENSFDGTQPIDPDVLLAQLGRPIVFVDLETTGSDPLTDRITEIGVVEASTDGLTQWDVLVDPEQPIPPFIQQLTGISDAMVQGQPTFAALAPLLAERLQGKLFVAHNARFDYGFLKNEFKRAGLPFRADVLCTVRLSRALFPSVHKHGLDALIERLGLVPKGRHRALADADLLWQFWLKIHQRYAAPLVDAAVQSLTRRASLPAALDENALQSLPQLPGVYVFYGDQDQTLYVGKSIDLRQRVAAHFAADHRDAKELRLSREVRRIAHYLCAGETGALLLESQMIKTLKPVHNRLLRRRGAPCCWHFPADALVPRLTTPHERDLGRTPDLFGIFDSRVKAEHRLSQIADEYRLCPACLGLGQGAGVKGVRREGPCFAFQTNRCEGACIGAESMAEHAARVREALEPLRIAPWPYDHAIAFEERHANGMVQWHVVENWCYLGTTEDEHAVTGIAMHSPTPLFDRDTYTILRRVLRATDVIVKPLAVDRSLSLVSPTAPPPSAPPAPSRAAIAAVAVSRHAACSVAVPLPPTAARRTTARRRVPATQGSFEF